MRWLMWLTVSSAAVPSYGLTRGQDELIKDLVKQFQQAVPNASLAGAELYGLHLSGLSVSSYTIPQQSLWQSALRRLGVSVVRSNFLYGPPVGGGPSYPAGLLGAAKVTMDSASILLDVLPRLAGTAADLAKAAMDMSKYNDLKNLDDYEKLYDGEWFNSLPRGPDPGVLSNYTQDKFFSMQRLSNSPYRVRRLIPKSDTLPFPVDAKATKAVCGRSLQQLFNDGRLFHADYRDQQGLALTPGQYTASTDAYFCIDSRSGDFLPLAIRTNAGANLTYTPLDSPQEWLLAKIMVNVNDFWFAQWNHLAFTHETVHIIWMAAIRSLSQYHPVYAVLDRLMSQVFSIQILAKVVLFSPGSTVDRIFPHDGRSAEEYSTSQYLNGFGNFQANFFLTNLRGRGLINSTHGPPLKSFPFYEDAGKIHSAIRKFFTAFVQSYYPSDAVLAADSEIQGWVQECNGPAKVFDFPKKIVTRGTLVDVLTQLAHLVSTAHHTVNTNELIQVSSALPFCPPSLYQPLPTTKNSSLNAVEWLPPLQKAFDQLAIGSLFARPSFAGSNRTILHMFNDQSMLAKMNPATRAANQQFMSEMKEFSQKVSSRTFDAKGLSQGMPFVWRALDPNVAPFSIAT
ncbi:lipoxygenase [Cercophora newfieldiana]|uniref:Manganese lipoxygenase n=1 Tax=Cercophora newfieldiana TaxID=92897 RepID=A0AA39XZR9_9PEZI|nr:lipoxygenase [Cercophora newfieldiana]